MTDEEHTQLMITLDKVSFDLIKALKVAREDGVEFEVVRSLIDGLCPLNKIEDSLNHAMYEWMK